MPCQSGDVSPRRRVRLTDQALVAVALARQLAGDARWGPGGEAPAGGRPDTPRAATLAQLVAALAAEPDGRAGRMLRERSTAAGRLAERAAAAPPGLPSLEVAVWRAASTAAPRTAGTAELLLAALESGGADLTGLVAAAGYGPRDLYRAAAAAPGHPWAPGAETVGLGADPDLGPGAGLAVARVRAAAGGAAALVLALATLPEAAEALGADVDDLAARVGAQGDGGTLVGEGDAGLDPVLTAARAWCTAPITATDLLRAAQLAGGPAAAALLEAAASSPADPGSAP